MKPYRIKLLSFYSPSQTVISLRGHLRKRCKNKRRTLDTRHICLRRTLPQLWRIKLRSRADGVIACDVRRGDKHGVGRAVSVAI